MVSYESCTTPDNQTSLYEECKRNASLKLTSGNTLIGEQLASAKYSLKKTGTPDGSCRCTLWRSGSVVTTSSNRSVTTLTTDFVEYTFTGFGSNTLAEDDYISITVEYTGGTDPDTDYITTERCNTIVGDATGAIGCSGSPNNDGDDQGHGAWALLASGSIPSSGGTRLPPPPLIARF